MVVSFLGMIDKNVWVVEPGIKQVHLHIHLFIVVQLNFQIMSAMKDSGNSGKLVCLSAMGVRDSW